MKLLFAILSILVTAQLSYSQNTFPTSGNVGIGTTSPNVSLHVVSNSTPTRFVRSKNDVSATGLFTITNLDNPDITTNNYAALSFTTRNLDGTIKNAAGIRGVFTGRTATAVTGELSFITIANGTNRESLRISSSGNIGIGTASPLAPIHIKESTNAPTITGAYSPTSLFVVQGRDSGIESISNNDDGSWGGFFSLTSANAAGLVDKWGIIRRTSNAGDGSFRITYGADQWVHANPLMFIIKPNGFVGIGTEDPDAFLTVKGDIHTQEIIVDLQGSVAPDYVFEESYDLRSLEDTEAYIKAHKHLPEIPSAAEMEDEGMKLNEMNLKLLQKVEELTLHMIEINKEVKNLREENQNLNERISEVEGH